MELGLAKAVDAGTQDLAPADLVASARRYAADAKAERTRRAYRSDWQGFTAWCDLHGVQPLLLPLRP